MDDPQATLHEAKVEKALAQTDLAFQQLMKYLRDREVDGMPGRATDPAPDDRPVNLCPLPEPPALAALREACTDADGNVEADLIQVLQFRALVECLVERFGSSAATVLRDMVRISL